MARDLRAELLAASVPPWTEAKAFAWWSARGERQGATSDPRRTHGIHSKELTIAIDMKARLADTDVA